MVEYLAIEVQGGVFKIGFRNTEYNSHRIHCLTTPYFLASHESRNNIFKSFEAAEAGIAEIHKFSA